MSKESYESLNKVKEEHLNLMKSIGERLEALRVKKGISVKALCTEVRISRTTYYRMAKGKVYFNTYKFLKILDELDATVEFRINEKEKSPDKLS